MVLKIRIVIVNKKFELDFSVAISFDCKVTILPTYLPTYLPCCIIVYLLLHRNNEYFKMKKLFLMQYHPFSKLEN
jgi:hypothetical protein